MVNKSQGENGCGLLNILNTALIFFLQNSTLKITHNKITCLDSAKHVGATVVFS